MKKYKVVFATSYEIEANDEDGALEEAIDIFNEQLDDGLPLFDILGSDVEEV